MTDNKAIQLQKLDDRALWYGSQYWQVPLVFLGAVGVVAAQTIDKAVGRPWLIPIMALLGTIAGGIVLWHMFMIDRNFKRLVDDIIRLETDLNVRNIEDGEKSATQPEKGLSEDHRTPMFALQITTTAALFIWFIWSLAVLIGCGCARP